MSDEEKVMNDAEEKELEADAAVEENIEEAESAVEDAVEAVEDKVEEVKEATEEKAEDLEEKLEKARNDAEEKLEEIKEKSHKEARREEKAAKKAAKAAEAQAAAAKKTVSTKSVAIIAILVCAAAVAGLVLFLNQPEKSVYEKINDYSKYVKLGDYKGLEYTKEEIKVTKKDIKTEIDSRLQAKATTKDSKKGTVKDGDNVKISYVGKINGKEFDGGSADDYTLTIGSGSFIDGFEEGLVGKKVGDKVTLDLKFPKDYNNKEVAGKDVTFEVEIKSKQVTDTPEYDEEFIKANSSYDNKADYEASVKEDLIKERTETAESTAKQTLWSEAVENAEVIKNPKGAVKQEQDSIIEQYKLMAQNYNMEWEDFLKTYMQSSEKDFNKQAKTYGKSVVKQKLVLYAIADADGIKVTNKEYKDRLKEMLSNAGMTEKQFKEQYNMTIEEYAEQNDFKANFLSEKVNDFIYKNGKAVSAKKTEKDD